MSRQKPNDDIDSVHQKGQVLGFGVEFACFVEHRRGNKRRVRYEVRINGSPSSATFYLEDDQAHPALADSQIEAACAYIQRFLRDGITEGIDAILQEAYQLTHGGQTPNKAFLSAFLRDLCDYIKLVSTRRLKSGVAERKREQWLKFEASAKCHSRTELLKEYQADYNELYQQYTKNSNQTGYDQFERDVWDEHEKRVYADRSSDFLKYGRLVAARSFTPGEAARQWVSDDMKIPASTLERRYIRKPFGKRRRAHG